ncbi:HEAT repeat domain-containing protein [Massilia genomosp. 1]|uniref:HEAT repeat domain-containing protein n=1 Tax=Massilia genomosp. 1 TaxID=2609280 RepID=A0ABX0MVJ9_9BURK|nr:HEAT repeat domain-containing protein [Massilia genomosp. 1]NHZ66764.1 hypothetical protein [Massilia genomosp. 1]
MLLQKNRKIIPAMVRRHVEDSAFYWSQIDASERSTTVSFSDLLRFNSTLRAHLDGVSVAGIGALPVAMAALERWMKPGEAFACSCAAMLAEDTEPLDALASKLEEQPDELLRGAISALAWIPSEVAERVIRNWTASGSSSVRFVVALRALYLINTCLVTAPLSSDSALWLQTPLHELLRDSDRHVRAAACRLAALEDEDEEIKDLLIDALSDNDLAVRSQAAISIARLAQLRTDQVHHGKRSNEDLIILGVETLEQSIRSQILLSSTATGWHSKQARRRLSRWIQHLAWMIKPGTRDLNAMLESMAVRSALHFVLHHGDPIHLPFVVKHLANPATARYAGWVWEVVTGIDLVESGLSLEEPSMSYDATLDTAPIDADFGLVLPNAEAISNCKLSLSTGQRYFKGQPIAVTPILENMKWDSQAERGVASQHLQTIDSLFIISVRAPAETQLRCIDEIKEIMRLEGTV